MKLKTFLSLSAAILLTSCALDVETRCENAAGGHFSEAYACIKQQPKSFFHEYSEDEQKTLAPADLAHYNQSASRRSCAEKISAMTRAGMLTDSDAWTLFRHIDTTYPVPALEGALRTPAPRTEAPCPDLDYLTRVKAAQAAKEQQETPLEAMGRVLELIP